MQVIIGFSALGIAIIGWIAWFMSIKTGPKPWTDLFRLIFFCGFLAFCMSAAGQLASCAASANGSGAAVKVGK